MEEIERATDVILKGGVVLLPTDTVYGLSANVFDDTAVEKIYQIKNRPSEKALPVLISDYTDLLKVAEIPSRLEGRLIEAFFPGPLTIVLKKKKGLNLRAFSGLSTVAVRMPDSEMVRNLISEVGTPLATTSANLSGEPATVNLGEISDEILDKVDFILDSNDKLSGTASTIVQVIDDKIEILREGAISREDIEKILI